MINLLIDSYLLNCSGFVYLRGLLLATPEYFAPMVSQTTGTIVWIGSLILTIAFFVMSWTKLGQGRPLVKCLVLSIFAHLLMVIFFYGTQWLGIRGNDVAVESVKISLVDVTAEQNEHDEVALADTINDNVLAEEAIAAQEGTVTSAGTEPMNNSEQVMDLMQAADISEQEDIAPVEPHGPTADSTAATEAVDIAATDDAGDVTSGKEESLPIEAQPISSSASDIVNAADVTVDSRNSVDSPPVEVGDPTFAAVTDMGPITIKRLDGTEIPRRYQNRFAPVIEQLTKSTVEDLSSGIKGSRFGATRDTAAAVEAALQWLVTNQEENGSWDASLHRAGVDRQVDGQQRSSTGINADNGITGLALLALLGDGNTHLVGPRREAVQHGLEYLLGQQAANGSLAGNATMFARMYCHAMATVAVCEAYAMTLDERLQRCAERAIEYTLGCQDIVTGGWRYQRSDPGDMSQFGWQVLALQSAQQAGISTPPERQRLMSKFLLSCNTGLKRGLASYRPGFGATAAMTAESMACRGWLDVQNKPEQLTEGTQYLLKRLPSTEQPDFYYWYYGSLSLRVVGGEPWERWADALTQTLPRMQRSDGSWSAMTKWAGYGGTVYSTAMGALCLESFYRYQ
ncbi:MAG: hypothetical protein HN617_10310 [Planctomycetaceae bacterium]|jgi:hypothetical protein|nr:hypothetical protein [Planctomycetaceae bacterium]MBT4726701.1 hypothetical protein [Planctomycetaceae bacterium]MBT4845845.1 hypothetical protein [Planctomycetaceae bacterium]MBT5599015.1 hypothetical protein [Planctomycetaceae bacterium]MBT5885332.1 hypothetical protein [Planctomycetaceae bacterium]